MRIHHVALRVADLEKCRAFYAGVLELKEIRHTGDAVWLRAGDVVLMLEARLRGTGQPFGSGHLLAFAVEDLPLWEKKLADAGVAIDDRTATTLYVRDPENHRVGLSVYPLDEVALFASADQGEVFP